MTMQPKDTVNIHATIDEDDFRHFMMIVSKCLKSIAYDIENLNISLSRIENKLCGIRPSIPDPFSVECEEGDR